MTARAYCDLHVTTFAADVGCLDCKALAAERLAVDLQPVPPCRHSICPVRGYCTQCGDDAAEVAAKRMAADMQPVPAEVAEDLADEPFQFAWSSMDGFWG